LSSSDIRRVVLGLGRDDRVVVGDLGVVHDTAERQRVEPGDVLRGRASYSRWRPDERGRRLDLARHVAGQEARVVRG
jgi:hypothetical protein